ncbi:serine/threonine protein kinase [Leishmania donovani]|uniref:Serine/threonine_protein_kinase_putative/GeneDB:L mjF.21.0130 n=1 Tax=Leishmania donovani TaxID=5661 RepID=A0A6J8F9H1_LEIDO|nr:serine/threonine protein kinase [Leishmania donovani]VDZ44368.1 serine/threonine_protein_kinase_putative/GeneDB:LmjF.21.0130 [Leishmania donovani]
MRLCAPLGTHTAAFRAGGTPAQEHASTGMQRGMEKTMSRDVDVESAFTALSPSAGEKEMVHGANAASGLYCFKDTLRIELPVISSEHCATFSSLADGTGGGSPETAIYRPSETAFSLEIEECTPLSIEEDNARQSAVALLQAGILPKSAGGSSRRGTSRRLPSFIPTFSSLEPIEAMRKKSPVSLFTSIRRKNICSLSMEADLTRGGEPDGVIPCSGEFNRSSGSFELHPDLTTVIARGASSAAPSPERQQRCGSTFTSPAPSQTASSMSLADESEESGDSSDQGIEMDLVLRDASKIRGLRLTWLLYMLIVMVIVLFVLVLVQITYETSRMLTRSATEAVQAQAASLLNSVDMQQYALEKLFEVMREAKITGFSPDSITHIIVRDIICSSLYRAPIAFAMYGKAGELQWKTSCKWNDTVDMLAELPKTVLPGIAFMRIVDYGKLALAYRTFYASSGGVETYVVMTEKETLGRILMNNDMADYSTATLQSVMTAFFLPRWNSTQLTMLFHTLTKEARSYTNTPTSPSAAALTAAFESLCHTDSPYVWHIVLMPVNASGIVKQSIRAADWPETKTRTIPTPRFEYKRTWGQLSKANLCGVKCMSAEGDKCTLDNPTNVWFLVDYTMAHLESIHTTVAIVGALSVMAVVIFSVIMFLVYLSITVPVNYLRYQLMRAVGSNEMATPWQRKIVRWTYRLWLGDLTSIARSIYILSLCFRLNKKYVPDHVLRNHAKQLYMRRRKFNFLEEADLKEDTMLEHDTDSDNEAESPLVGVNTVLPPSDKRFLWHFSVTHDKDEADHAASENGVGARISDGATFAEVSPVYAPRPQLPTTSYEVVVPCGRAAPAPRGVGLPRDVPLNVKAYGELEDTVAMQEASTMAAATAMTTQSSNDIMSIRREYETTVLCIRIPSVELAYLINYSGAAHQHRRLMRVLLHRIRRHKGALFHCSGDCLGAVWNAFEGCPNHAECAAVCAQEIANAFAPYRSDGLYVGMVLHQGTLVCGTVEYSKTAFVTAFGDGPREALAVAELAAAVKTLNVLVTEPVKQALSGLYDCNIVDVIQLPNSAHPLLLFELSGSRTPEGSLNDTHLQAPTQAEFSIDYARAFAQFRNHEFSKALQSIQKLRTHISSRNVHLLRRLERLCLFYSAQPAALPRPYHRAFPVWVNYEAIAQAGLRNDPHLTTSQTESLTAHNMNRGLVYQGVPVLRNDMDCIRDFKQELQANMRRLVSPQRTTRQSGSPTLDNAATPTQDSLHASLPMRSTPLPMPMSAGMLLEVSGDLSESLSAAMPAKPRYVDPQENAAEMSLPPLRPAPVVTVAPPCFIAGPPLVAASAATPIACEEAKGRNGPEWTSPEVSSPHGMPFPSRHPAVTHSATNLPPVAVAGTPDLVTASAALLQSAATHTDSINSSAQADGASCSIIQSAGLSFQETGGMRGFCVSNETLPATIKAKNGTTYLRSTRILGKGSFGCVYLGMDAHSGRLVAIKFLPLPSDESGMEVIEAEVLILQRVNDTHVVQLLSYAFEGDTIVIFMECMLAGSLQNMIAAFRTIPSSTARVFMRDVLRGLSKLHSMGVIHRDMKPQNVLLSFAGNCKISDFGASAWLQELARKESKGEVCGTPVYLAPEAARGSPEKESDIWSCGIMFLHMITGRLPYSLEQLALGAAALVYQIGSGIAQPNIPDDLDVLDAEFVRACLDKDPSKRTSAAGLLQLALFTV